MIGVLKGIAHVSFLGGGVLADRRSSTRSPEMRLVAAMFEDALRSVFRHADARRGPRRREFIEACEWLLDDRRDWPFAFTNVCDLLGLDATAVRQSLFGSSGSMTRMRSDNDAEH